MINSLISTAAWVVGSVIWIELVRDFYHLASHYWPSLYRLHVWHHRVFRPDLSVVSEKIYRQAQWRNDVPECLVMLVLSLLLLAVAYRVSPEHYWGAFAGCFYTLSFLLGAIARGSGIKGADQLTDLTHLPGTFLTVPANWLVNRPYHWRHHFDNQNAYYSGTLTIVDKLMGTALSLKGKSIAVTGASGTLGKALLQHLRTRGAKVIALSSKHQEISIPGAKGEIEPVNTITWQVGQESELAAQLEKVDILIINHGINVHGERTAAAIGNSYEINTFSSWRLLELFFTTVRTNKDIACKEVWVNTSEAEVIPALSPLYELSKRALGDLVTLRRLDAPCVVRKLILGPFKSNLNPIGVMSADWVAKQIINLAIRDVRNIIVTINPLTFLAFPIREFMLTTYFKLFSRRTFNSIPVLQKSEQLSQESSKTI
ncbi:MAG: bifunctional sterol desaturase/short chain dehydrogenase [Symploca sp. SIO3C6]|uniref:Bifunctional sterol desaturase/short chain dehydrogenase n=1 Tax=Symploca sp. SIO1C4 TaxID=2607765 RepID=A0A6B3NFL2_9CYAN|nr:bifunctional sterol desaturase/short chain dehydrogenase [Symploca sp. SIO3C6]NER31929.1 bifunctional sterol desaturase/short chain dehydrogenase [Symploca sp. SIO1C4]NET04384.1 bifunctional sterol desaturase/short chain dehydrogenase [Symploca sp. SIO2B6]